MTSSATPANRFQYWDETEGFDVNTRQQPGTPIFDEEEERIGVGGEKFKKYTMVEKQSATLPQEQEEKTTKKDLRNITNKFAAKLSGKAPVIGIATGLPSFIEGYNDTEKITKAPLEQVNGIGGMKGMIYTTISPLEVGEDLIANQAQQTWHDPDKSSAVKGVLATAHGVYYVANRTVAAPAVLVGQIGRFFTSLFDEGEGVTDDLATNTIDADRRAAIFGADPQSNVTAQAELLTPATANQLVADPIRDSVLEGDDQIDSVIGETANDENVGGMYNRVTSTGGTLITESSYNGEKVSDQLASVDEQQNTQFDAVTEYALNYDDAASFDWFQTHHDDGIMDGYLDTAETANRDMIITEFPEFFPGQTITLDESGTDGLVAAGPFDAVTLNEPQNNNVF